MRVLLSVGCDDYLHASDLTGAVKDARSIFSTLVGDQEHQYDEMRSKFLISPSTEEFRQTLSELLYSEPNISVFALFFAGHAAVVDETLYLALRDTLPSRIPGTAIGFPEILRTTAGARPKQANFVLDACNAGGLGFDIGSILKRTIVGNSDTMGISFIASSAAEQSASESSEGGNFTLEFVKTLNGERFVQQMRPFLSLAEMAQQIQAGVPLGNQAISYWTLNLQGPNLFAKNPHFSGPAYATDTIVSQLQKQRMTIETKAAEFKSAIIKLTGGVNERAFSKILEGVFSEIDPDQRSSLIYGLAEGLKVELAEADDPFVEARVLTVLLGQILESAASDGRKFAMDGLIEWFVSANRKALSMLYESLNADRNALLIDGFSDLYKLPIRISDIFGQCALLFFSQRNFAEGDSVLVSAIVQRVLDRYGNSVLALADDQATGYLLFLEMCRRNRWSDFTEEVVGRLYYDLHRNFARCGAYGLGVQQQYELLGQRYKNAPSATEGLYSYPSDLTSVILSFSALNSLDEFVDFTLIEIDHTTINFFVPDKFDRFGLVDGLQGTNYTLTLGRDFWRCIDLRRILRDDIIPMYFSSASTLTWEENFCSLAAALALRDRLPWQVVSR